MTMGKPHFRYWDFQIWIGTTKSHFDYRNPSQTSYFYWLKRQFNLGKEHFYGDSYFDDYQTEFTVIENSLVKKLSTREPFRLSGFCRQGCKNAWIFLTPNFMLSTFLQDFPQEIDEDAQTMPMKYVWNMSNITISVSLQL